MRAKPLLLALLSPIPLLLAAAGRAPMEAALPAALLLLALSYALDGWAEDTPEAARAAKAYALLAVCYSAAALAYTRSTPVLAAAAFASTYSVLGALGLAACTPALLLTVAFLFSLVLPAAPLPLAPLVALSFVAAPALYSAWIIRCSLRRRRGEPCEVAPGKYAALTLFFTGVTAAMVGAVVYVSPLYAPMLALMLVAAAGSLRAAVLSARGELWSYSSYTGFDESLIGMLQAMLRETGWRYRVRGLLWRRGVRVDVEEPFRARITVREWRHRYHIYGAAPGTMDLEPGLIVEVRPGPSRAPTPLREFMSRYLEAAGLIEAAYEWRQINSWEQ